MFASIVWEVVSPNESMKVLEILSVDIFSDKKKIEESLGKHIFKWKISTETDSSKHLHPIIF